MQILAMLVLGTTFRNYQSSVLLLGVTSTSTVAIYVGNYPRCWVPLEFRVGSLWIPSGKKWRPFISMHNGRVNDVIYCYNLGFLHTNKNHSRTIKTINLPRLALYVSLIP